MSANFFLNDPIIQNSKAIKVHSAEVNGNLKLAVQMPDTHSYIHFSVTEEDGEDGIQYITKRNRTVVAERDNDGNLTLVNPNRIAEILLRRKKKKHHEPGKTQEILETTF